MSLQPGREHRLAGAPGHTGRASSGLLATLSQPAALLAVYVPLLFLSALLMFWVEPLIGKLILPLLGGTPMVWTTCMVFFQAMLLAGYGYAHLTLRLGVRRQATLHLVIVALSIVALPIGNIVGWVPPTGSTDPRPWLLGWLIVAVGAPFFVLAATAPMLQAWFARTDHPDARDPYFLYATSNAGSLIGLLGFPALAEPLMTLPEQSWAWSGTYVAFGLLLVLAALTLRRNGRGADRPVPAPAAAVAATETAPPATATHRPTLALRLRWVLLALAPSSLLLGLTTFVTTDIAAVPLLWIIPLAAYLITFMIAFAKRPLIGHRVALIAQPVVVVPALLLFFWGLNEATWWVMALHFCAFFLTALVCHGELARTRPDSRHLTEFYLLLSLGGVLGGLFNALVAPMVFTTTLEYPLAMTAALLLRPLSGADSGRARLLDLIVPAGWFVAMLLFARVTQKDVTEDDLALLSTISLVLALACFVTIGRPIRFGLMMSAIVAAGWIVPQFTENVIFANRNFYGILRVVDDTDDQMRTIYHGTTQHGAQLLTPSLRLKPITYYVEGSPIAQVFEDVARRHPDGNIAVLGLGAGTLACLAKKGEHVTFYEIDPAVETVARDPKLFTFLKDCPPKLDVVLGDGRLTMARAPDHGYDLIVLDAFTSDAVPMHLLTSEAARLYRTKLKDDGIIIFNVSNRYLDLAPVLGAVAPTAGMVAFTQDFDSDPNDPAANDSSWVVMVPAGAVEARLEADKRWKRVTPPAGLRPWTDGFSNLLSAIQW